MVLGVNDQTLIHLIGHDGSELAISSRPRAFHVQELVRVVRELGFSATPVERKPIWYFKDGTYVVQKQLDDNSEYFERTIQTTQGVITGYAKQCGHAVAYDRGRIYDPDGFEYDFGEERFDAQIAWVIERRAVFEGGGEGSIGRQSDGREQHPTC